MAFVSTNGGVACQQFPFRCDELLLEDIVVEWNPVDCSDFAFGIVFMDHLFVATAKKREREGTSLVGMNLLPLVDLPD